jgi:hypothetical protein
MQMFNNVLVFESWEELNDGLILSNNLESVVNFGDKVKYIWNTSELLDVVNL